MTQQNSTVHPNSPSVPSTGSGQVPNTGMRGGLGRTLLTAFLLLSIIPLSVISFVAASQARKNLERELVEKLATIAELTGSQVKHWVDSQQDLLAVLANSIGSEVLDAAPEAGAAPSPDTADPGRRFESPKPATAAKLPALLQEVQRSNPAILAFLIVDAHGNVLSSLSSLETEQVFADLTQDEQALVAAQSPIAGSPASLRENALQATRMTLTLSQPIPAYAGDDIPAYAGDDMPQSELSLLVLIDMSALAHEISTPPTWSKNGAIYLVSLPGAVLKLSTSSADIESDEITEVFIQTDPDQQGAIASALAGQPVVRHYDNHQETPVIGVYHGIAELDVAVLVEQAQASALASSDELAVVLIGATLAGVLLTALIAATVTRRITLPIVELTATAVQIASGDLNQKVPTTRRDEIGILARAFNVMTTKLRVLYEDLEQKVQERTRQLQEANAKIRYRAMQLAVSAEVGRVVTSILERESLLGRVVELVRDCFQAYFVAVYLTDESGHPATSAGTGRVVLEAGSGALGQKLKADRHYLDLNMNGLVSQAANSREPRMAADLALDAQIDRRLFPHTRAELAVPLQVGGRLIGVLDVHSTDAAAFDDDEIMVLETLAGQVSVAIENARAYELERQAAEQLRDVEHLRRTFLSNMSRELRMPLNNIIGFSRVMLKGIDGPVTELQREDLSAIHESGQQLLVLINDILDIAQIEAGAMELNIRPVDLSEIAHSVIPTTKALLQGRPIDFYYEICPDLPPVLADAQRLRQVLVKLISNASKFTHKGEIRLRVWEESAHVMVGVSDTGIGIPTRDRDKVFEMFRRSSAPGGDYKGGAGLGLTFSKEIVKMHGGTIRLHSQEGKGSTFTIALPVLKTEQHIDSEGKGS